MAGIREELTLVDSFSGTFNQFNTAAGVSIATAEAFKSALDQFTAGFLEGLTEELQRTSLGLGEATNESQRAAQSAQEMAAAQAQVAQGINEAANAQRQSAQAANETANAERRVAQGANAAANAQRQVTRETRSSANAVLGWLGHIRNAVTALGSNNISKGFSDAANEINQVNAALDKAANGAQREAQNANEAAESHKKGAQNANEAANAQARVTQETKASADAAAGWVNHIKSAVAALGVAKLTKEFIDTADELTLINARLDAVADETLGVGELQEQIFQAAQRSRASYQDTATLVGRIAQNARGVFNNAEAVKFAENMNKMFKLGGANQQEMASATLQLSQALATGVLRGEEFNAVNEAAPAVIKQIADAMDVEVSQMRQMAQDGKITADIIKNAMLNATDEIDAAYAELPKTWEDMMTEGKNVITWALSDIMEQWTEFLNSTEGQTIFKDALATIVTFAQIGSEALMAMANGLAWVYQNWNDLIPIINMVGAAILTYAAIQVASAIQSAAAWAIANWQLLLIVAGIAIVITALQSMGVTWSQIGAFVGAVLGALYTTAANIFITLWNGVIAPFAEFFANVFNDPVAAVVNLFADAFNVILGFVAEVAAAIDSILGSNLSSAIGSFKNDFISSVKAEYSNKNTVQRMEYVDGATVVNDFATVGASLGGKLDNMNLSLNGILGGVNSIDASTFNLSDNIGGAGEVGKVGSVGKIDNDVTLSDEDLKIYRDLAEQRYMTNVELKTLAPNISITMPDGQNMSPQDVANAIRAMLIEQMAANAATAH